MKLKDNDELLEFLQILAEKANSRGNRNLSIAIAYATEFYFGSATEFLRESQKSLQFALKEKWIWSLDEQKDISDVLVQIKDAFDMIGGA
ncbi:hypothetical protein CHISP_2648 [Chitinispirillum alkaliphilum]|nr:hypothetical protein CHISP_2648 [Chitinispirillum alkaliphilum]